MNMKMSKAVAIDRVRRITTDSTLPVGDKEGIESLLTAGELQVAFENLATQIDEYELDISRIDRDALVEIGRQINIAESYLSLLAGS